MTARRSIGSRSGLEVRARTPDVELADLGATAIRRRLACEELRVAPRPLQAWWLDVAAESVAGDQDLPRA